MLILFAASTKAVILSFHWWTDCSWLSLTLNHVLWHWMLLWCNRGNDTSLKSFLIRSKNRVLSIKLTYTQIDSTVFPIFLAWIYITPWTLRAIIIRISTIILHQSSIRKFMWSELVCQVPSLTRSPTFCCVCYSPVFWTSLKPFPAFIYKNRTTI